MEETGPGTLRLTYQDEPDIGAFVIADPEPEAPISDAQPDAPETPEASCAPVVPVAVEMPAPEPGRLRRRGGPPIAVLMERMNVDG